MITDKYLSAEIWLEGYSQELFNQRIIMLELVQDTDVDLNTRWSLYEQIMLTNPWLLTHESKRLDLGKMYPDLELEYNFDLDYGGVVNGLEVVNFLQDIITNRENHHIDDVAMAFKLIDHVKLWFLDRGIATYDY